MGLLEGALSPTPVALCRAELGFYLKNSNTHPTATLQTDGFLIRGPKIITQYQSQSPDTPQDFPGSEREIPEALGTRMCPSRCQMAISITVISKLKLRLMALVP